MAFADAFLAAAGPPPDAVRDELVAEFSAAELAELATGMALFHGFSKLMIAVGCEPEQMDITELPTPDIKR